MSDPYYARPAARPAGRPPIPLAIPTAEAAARYLAGETLAQVSRRAKVSIPTLRRHLLAAGVQMRPKGRVPADCPAALPAAQGRRYARASAWRAKGWTLAQIGDMLGVSRQRVWQMLAWAAQRQPAG